MTVDGSHFGWGDQCSTIYDNCLMVQIFGGCFRHEDIPMKTAIDVLTKKGKTVPTSYGPINNS